MSHPIHSFDWSLVYSSFVIKVIYIFIRYLLLFLFHHCNQVSSFTISLMVTYSIIFLLFLTIIDSQNLSQDLQTRHIWHTILDKLTDKFNVDNRHFDKEEMLLFPEAADDDLIDEENKHDERFDSSTKNLEDTKTRLPDTLTAEEIPPVTAPLLATDKTQEKENTNIMQNQFPNLPHIQASKKHSHFEENTNTNTNTNSNCAKKNSSHN